jgi:oligoxyloglucan reducing-end-specific cellobiohydrolase
VTWVRINDDAHQYGGAAIIQGDPRVYGRVYMGMFGRGIIYADIAGGGRDTV